MKESKSVNILGQEVVLKRRVTKDVNDLADWVRANNDGSPLFGLYSASIIISRSLKRTCSTLKWYQFKARRIYKRLMNPDYLLKRLDVIELNFYQVVVLTLEQQFDFNIDELSIETFNMEMLTQIGKKKVQGNQPEDSEQKL
jgi:hypothetical protein